jgi:hypothetical protein
VLLLPSRVDGAGPDPDQEPLPEGAGAV